MFKCRSTSVTAGRFVRRLTGGSQAMLVDASDGRQYVVKFANNPQGPNVLCNEALGTELYRALGLPVPEWTTVLIPRTFLLRYPNCSMAKFNSGVELETGLCFGSRVVAAPAGRIYEMLPGSFIRRVANRSDFWLAWLVDLCADHRDNRQSIFTEYSSGLHAIFVDHGHMFGGPDGSRKTPLTGPRYWDTRVYALPDAEKISRRLRRISSTLDTDRLFKRMQEIPEAWLVESALENFHTCIERLCRADYLEKTFEEVLAAFENSYANGRAIPQLEHSEHPALLCSHLRAGSAGRQAIA
ncbi:MAG: HipA family kinase [Acidobacteriota bacterium]